MRSGQIPGSGLNIRFSWIQFPLIEPRRYQIIGEGRLISLNPNYVYHGLVRRSTPNTRRTYEVTGLGHGLNPHCDAIYSRPYQRTRRIRLLPRCALAFRILQLRYMVDV